MYVRRPVVTATFTSICTRRSATSIATCKVADYNLTIPIPNDLAKTVVGMIREKNEVAEVAMRPGPEGRQTQRPQKGKGGLAVSVARQLVRFFSK
jgi:hypothetical protein